MAGKPRNYIIEHMEEGMHDWCKLEYEHMITVCGPEHVYFTALTPKTLADMPETLAKAHCHTEDIMSMGIPLENVCLLDPASPIVLGPEDGDKFEFFLFGGILGDDPPRDRTGELRKLGFATRHLGPIQMTTDTAVNVTRRIVEDRVPLDKIPFVDHPEIKLGKKESVTMPFRYIVKEPSTSMPDPEGTPSSTTAEEATGTAKKSRRAKGPEPLLPPGMLELLKKDNDAALDLL